MNNENKFNNAMRERLRFNKLWINQWEEYFSINQ